MANAMKEARRARAEARQAIYDKLSVSAKLEQLDRAFGPDQGAIRQRKRLMKHIMVRVNETLFKEPGEPGQAPIVKKDRRG